MRSSSASSCGSVHRAEPSNYWQRNQPCTASYVHVIVPGHGVAALGSHRYCTVAEPLAVQLPAELTHWMVELTLPADDRCAQQIIVPPQSVASSHVCWTWLLE